MDFQFCLEKLLDSEVFIDFKKEFPDAFLCSGFFTLDKEGTDNQQHLDYWAPSVKKLYSFKLNESPIVKIETETNSDFIPKKIKDNIDFDLERVEKLIEEKMSENKMNNRVQKLIFSLQNTEEKDYLLVTVFLSGLGLIKVMYDIDKKEVTEFEKKSFFDMMKFIGKKKE